MYITVTDPIGGIFMGDNSPVAVNHRVLYENKGFYGFESLVKRFGSQQDLINFLMLAMTEPTGKFGRFTWQHK